MGLLDRFKKDPGPDALTWEAVARSRATPGVAGAEPVDADTVHVTWTAHPGTTLLSLAEVREEWTRASGFARIELMDQVVAGLAPPTDVELAAEPGPAATEAGGAWEDDRVRLGIVVGRTGTGAVRWALAGGALEARAVLDETDVGAADLERWGVGADEVRAEALAALAALDPELDPIAPGAPAWVPTAPAAHPPVWLAAPDRLLSAAGLRSAILLAPTPTELVLVDPAAEDLLTSVLGGTRSIVADADDVLLAAPLLAEGDAVAEWTPAAGHPCAGLVDDLRRAAP